jgi:hypothetical protein
MFHSEIALKLAQLSRKRQLMGRDQLLFMHRRMSPLFHYDDKCGSRFYYCARQPESLENFIGRLHWSEVLPGTKPVEFEPQID